MNIQLKKSKGIPIIALVGEVNTRDADSLEEQVDAITIKDAHKKLVFDLSRATFIASNIFGILLATATRLNQDDGLVALAGPTEKIRELLRMLSMTQFFQIYSTLKDAVSSLKKK